MNFHLEVYSGDEYLGVVRVANRYAQAVIGSQTYPFSRIEDACVALLAMASEAHLAKEAQKTRQKE